MTLNCYLFIIFYNIFLKKKDTNINNDREIKKKQCIMLSAIENY